MPDPPGSNGIGPPAGGPTEPPTTLLEPPPAPEPGVPPVESAAGEVPGSHRPRRAVFSLSGRAAPGLYAAGWFLTLFGLGILAFLDATGPGGGGLGPHLLLETGFLSAAIGLIAGGAAQAMQRRADGLLAYPGPSPFLSFAAFLMLVAAVAIPLQRLVDLAGIRTGTAGALLVSLLLFFAGYVIVVQLLAVSSGALSWREVVRPTRMPFDAPEPDGGPVLVYGSVYPAGARRSRPDLFGDVVFGLSLLLPTLIVTAILEGVLLGLLGLQTRDISSPIPVTVSDVDRWLTFIAAAVVAPIGEEVFFRGFATNAWARSYGIRRAIVQGGLFFAFVHILDVLGPNADVATRAAIFAFAARLPVALALGWLYLRRRSLFASWTLHAAYNGALIVIAWSAVS